MTPTKADQGSLSTSKVFLILEYLATNRIPVRLQDAAAHLKMPQPTLLRYLNTMIKENYVYQDEETMRYALTWKICKISGMIYSPLGLRSMASPYLNQLSQALHLGVCIVVLRGYESIYVDVVDDPSTLLNSLQRIGKQAPLHATGSGKVLLSQFSPHEFDGYIQAKGLPKLTEHTITDREELETQLQQVREQGYARDREECEENIQCISVPIYDFSDKIAAALSAFGNSDQKNADYMEDIALPSLKEVSRKISLRLGCSSDKLQIL